MEVLELEEKKLSNGLTSKIRGIMKTEGVDREEATKILKEIQEENLLLNQADED